MVPESTIVGCHNTNSGCEHEFVSIQPELAPRSLERASPTKRAACKLLCRCAAHLHIAVRGSRVPLSYRFCRTGGGCMIACDSMSPPFLFHVLSPPTRLQARHRSDRTHTPCIDADLQSVLNTTPRCVDRTHCKRGIVPNQFKAAILPPRCSGGHQRGHAGSEHGVIDGSCSY